jgi:hypothetical protein
MVVHLQKRSLKDVKRKNRQTVVNSLIENNGLSRVEIAQKTELAPSTVSALVTELIGDGILIEAGTIGTAGRSRTALTVNPEFGSIAIVEVSRRETRVSWFDMSLQHRATDVISRRYVTGNQLLALITNHIHETRKDFPPLAGLGLLFQEDMRESDFRVMYSTGFSSASITLKEALITQYRIPIEEEYSIAYTVSHALAEEVDLDTRNSAHISVGSRILASVTLNGADVPLRNDFCEELACAMEQRDGCSADRTGVVEHLSWLIAMLCMMFPLDTVFLSGKALPEMPAEQHLYQRIRTIWNSGKLPKLKFLRSAPRESGSAAMAAQLRKRALIG